MANPLYNGNKPTFSAIIERAQELRKNMTQDPKQVVQRLLNSGEMSQAEFNRLMPVAQQIAAMMPHK